MNTNIIKKKIRKTICLIKMYGFKCVVFDKACQYTHLIFSEESWFHKKVINFRNNKIMSFLERNGFEKCFSDGQTKFKIDPNSTIWQFWGTGVLNAPSIVKACMGSVKKNAGDRSVIQLDLYNVKDYIDIPDFFLSKYNAGKLSITHFSDYIRCSILEKYGGVWLDATIFLSAPLPDSLYHYELFTIHTNEVSKYYIAGGKWATYFLACGKCNSLMTFIKKALELYWKSNDKLVDYLLFDYLIYFAYSKSPEIGSMIEKIPYNNQDVLQFVKYLECKYDKDLFRKICGDTYIHKLSWKENITYYGSNKENTFIEHILRGYI